MKESQHLEQVAGFYHSREASEGIDDYHLYLRDVTIPEEGGDSALELGCGSGRWTGVLCERYQQVHVVDASQALVGQLRTRLGEMQTRLTSDVSLIEDFLKRNQRKWEHVYLSMLLEHVVDPVDILRGVGKALASEGLAFIVVPNATSVHRVLAHRAGLIETVDQLSQSDVKVGHRRVYTLDLLREHVRKAGLEIVEILPVGLKPVTHAQLKILPKPVITALCQSADIAPEHPAYYVLKAR